MKKMNKFVFILLLLLSCGNKQDDKYQYVDKQQSDKEDVKNSLEKANRYLLVQEAEYINDYIERHKLNVIQTGTGLRYQIVSQGDGELICEGDVVTIEYEVRLLNGDLIYSSQNDGRKTFLVGRGGVESGLEEAILKLRKNSTAILILPAHLAHGLIGDGNKVPPRATLVYRLKVIDKQ
jgi:FKBP-type peptidyl-prolyl cis-trans isomerase